MPEVIAARFVALGGGKAGREMARELWGRPRFSPERIERVLVAVEKTRARLDAARAAYADHLKAKDKSRKSRQKEPWRKRYPETPCFPEGKITTAEGKTYELERAAGPERAFWLASGRRLDDDLLDGLRRELASLKVPQHGETNLVARLLDLARG